MRRNLTTQKAHDVPAAKTPQGMVGQVRVDLRQRLGLMEKHIARVFALRPAPEVLQSHRPADLRRARMDLPYQCGQRLLPPQLYLSRQQLLSPCQVLHPNHCVLPLDESDSFFLQLPGEPMPSIQTEVDLEGKPALKSYVHEAKLLVLKIKVVVQALAGPQFQPKVATLRILLEGE